MIKPTNLKFVGFFYLFSNQSFQNQSELSSVIRDRYVYLRIIVDGTSRELSTKRTWQHDRWNQAIGRANGSKEDAKSLNAYLEGLSAKIYQAKASLIESNKSITAESLKNTLTGQGGERQMLLVIFKNHMDIVESLVGKDYAYRTLQRYRTAFGHTKAFIQWKYKAEDLEIRELDYEFASDFSLWLKTVKSCQHNATMKYVSTIKTLLIQCIKKGWLKHDPFLNFKTTQKKY